MGRRDAQHEHLYAEIIDRHVELASDLAWLGSLLDNLDPSDDDPLQKVRR